MKKKLLLLCFAVLGLSFVRPPKQYLTRNGQVTFFSYAKSQNISAENTEVLSIMDIEKEKIAVNILMRAFEFEKSLMQEHFNDSYVESDVFPRATFEGKILDFKKFYKGKQTCFIKGDFTLHGITKPMKIKASIESVNGDYIVTGETSIDMKDFKVKIPKILESKIAKTVKITFNFKYEPYEK